jgi:hypothetical protein
MFYDLCFSGSYLVYVLSLTNIDMSTPRYIQRVLCFINYCTSMTGNILILFWVWPVIACWSQDKYHYCFVCQLSLPVNAKKHINIMNNSKLTGTSWPWSYGSWLYSYLCNPCLLPLMLRVRIAIRARCTPLCDKVCQWLATGRWFSQGPPVSSTNKTDCHDITEILLKVALNTIKQTNTHTN